MRDQQIEALADEVLAAFDQVSPPTDLRYIAFEERIELVEGDFGEDFHGRIEFLPEAKVFAIYYPSAGGDHYLPRVRFSLAHEFGHYYLPEHREMLLKEISHNSLEGFHHNNQIEREADVFSAALLIPTITIRSRMGRRGFLSLQQILDLASECQASAQATAFRYTRFAKEPHLAIVSESGKIAYYFVSEEARALGFGGLGNKVVPADGPTQRAARSIAGYRIEEGRIESERWFSERQAQAEMWEEAIRLGSSDRVLTLLSWANWG